MDPYNNQRYTGNQRNPRRNHGYPNNNAPGEYGDNDQQTPENNPNRDAPDPANPPATDRQPQYAGAFTVFPPNESRRSENQRVAQKEEEALQRYREENRPTAVHINPEPVGGGGVTMAAAREKQLNDARSAKLQKKLRKQELDRRKRQEEEEMNQKMKDEARQKAERLAERRQREDQMRTEQHRQDHLRTTDRFLQRFERTAPGPQASSSATHTSSGSAAMESTQRQKGGRDLQHDHRRVNSAFLDRLEGQVRGRGEGEGFQYKEETLNEGLRQQTTNAYGQFSPQPDREQDFTGWRENADPECDRALMKLMQNFPDASRAVLEDILDQCNGEYDQAYTLLTL